MVEMSLEHNSESQSISWTSDNKLLNNNQNKKSFFNDDDNIIQYRKGDYAFFELSNKEPYVIRRIDEIFRTEENLIEVRCTKVYRKKDLPQNLYATIDEKFKKRFLPLLSIERSGDFYENHLAIIENKEIFVGTEIELILLEKARGKCMAIVMSLAEDIYDYIHLNDVFFFFYTYDKESKVFGTDFKTPRIGDNFQATNLPLNIAKSHRDLSLHFDQIWRNDSYCDLNQLKDYLTLVRSVGILARSSDATILSKRISLETLKSDSLRDSTIQTAFTILHSLDYDCWKAISVWVQGNKPMIVTDEKESWLNDEVTSFEDALEIHGKNFHLISTQILKWKSTKSIVEFYYMWKTTGRYLTQRLKRFHDPSSLKTKELKSCRVRKSTERHSMRFESSSVSNNIDATLANDIISNSNDPMTDIKNDGINDNKDDDNYVKSNKSKMLSKELMASFIESNRLMKCHSCKQQKLMDNFYFVSAAQMQTVCSACWIFWKRVGIFCHSLYDNKTSDTDDILTKLNNYAMIQPHKTHKCFFIKCSKIIHRDRLAQHLMSVHMKPMKIIQNLLKKNNDDFFLSRYTFDFKLIFSDITNQGKSIKSLYKRPFDKLPNMHCFYEFTL